MNGIFEPTMSTNTIWVDEEPELCLTVALETLEGDIAALETGKANLVHTHGQYADIDHEHTEYASTVHTHSGYANANHTHSGYASVSHGHAEYANVNHDHTEYALATDVDALETKVGDTTVASQISSAIATKADVSHEHSGYSPISHAHSDYAQLVHEHDNYADADHTHSGFAAESHTHSIYAQTSHEHTGYATTDHTHTEFSATGHTHSDYALESDLNSLELKVGDTSVSAQITSAISSKADTTHTHDDYALSDHSHSAYAPMNHEHDEYSLNTHSHTGFATSSHVHSYNDLENLPTIPTSLPANGGNADTVDGKHASEFAAATDMTALQTLVGDTSVASQISAAIQSIDMSEFATELYVDTQVSALVDSAPGTLNTLNELAAALGDDPNFATTVATQIGGKVDKVEGRGLSTNDYTTSEKNKLAGIAVGANKTTVDSMLSTTSTNPIQNKIVTEQINSLSALIGDSPVSTQISSAIAENSYTLPSAGSSLGGVISGGDVTISAGVISVNDDSHNHVIANVDGLQTALDGKAASGHTHSDYVNQNAFSNVKVGTTIIAADSVTDTLTIAAGSNITIAPDVTNDKITISATDTVYTHPNSGVTAGTYKSVTVNAAGHVTGGSNPTTLSGFGITDAATKTELNNLSALVGDTEVSEQISSAIAGKADSVHNHSASNITSGTLPITRGGTGATTAAAALQALGLTATAAEINKMDGITATTTELNYVDGVTSNIQTQLNAKAASSHSHNAATTSVAGLMSASDKVKLDGIAAGANKITVDSALSTTSANPVQNKVVTAQLNSLGELVGDASVSEQISGAVGNCITGLSVSGKVVTYTKGDGTTGTITTQDTNTTYSAATTSAAGLMSAADKTKLNGIATGANKTIVDSAISTTSTNPLQNKVIASEINQLGAEIENKRVFSSLTDIGITTFPTTMSAVVAAMPQNSMIIMDTRRINGEANDYATEIISDWGNRANGMAIIFKGVTAARVTMMVMYGTAGADHGDLSVGNYATTDNRVNWNTMDGWLDAKVDKVSKLSGVNLNTVTESGLYYVSSGTAALNYPAGSNGHMLVMSDGTRVRQVYFRVGTVDTNSFQWYSRHLGSDLTVGDNGWSKWWLLSGSESVWSGTAKLNAEINLGSRYGCQAWVIAGQVTNTDTYSTIYVPRQFLTTNQTKYKLQIADETGYVSFYFYYKESDDNVYAKIIWVSDTNNSALRFAYRVS